MRREIDKRYIDSPVYRRLLAPGPKRILALDGGGVRGALTIGYLERIEEVLRARYSDSDYRLCQYYDLIGGTSTGSIIATLLAEGKEISEIKDLYLELGKKIFSKKYKPYIKWHLRHFLSAKYSEKPLEEELENRLGNKVLGSSELKTGLCIVARRADNYGTYGFHNHPGGKYYEDNKGIYLKDLVRASTAAPTYFKSKAIQLGDNEIGVFVDGGVSSANNPALFMFLISTMAEHGFNWHLGKDELMITSIGTGSYRPKIQMRDKEKLINKKSVSWASELPNLFMADANSLNQTLLDFLANPNLSKHIQSNGQSPDKQTRFSQGAFSYKRYNIRLSKNELQEIGLGKSEEQLKSLREMDKGENAKALYDIGTTHAASIVCDDDFRKIFDLTYDCLNHKDNVLSYQTILEKFQPILKEKGILYKKYKHVMAKKAEGGERIITYTDNLIETINTAKAGDYIVENQTTDKERYIVKANVFNERYKVIKTLPDGRLECLPLGNVYGIQLDEITLSTIGIKEHFYFHAPWGEIQYARRGDSIVCNFEYKDIYRVSQQSFYETYVKL